MLFSLGPKFEHFILILLIWDYSIPYAHKSHSQNTEASAKSTCIKPKFCCCYLTMFYILGSVALSNSDFASHLQDTNL